MNQILKLCCLTGLTILVGCGGSSSSTEGIPAEIADIQGKWAGTCVPRNFNNTSVRVEFAYTRYSFVQSEALFQGSINCDTDAIFYKNQHGTFELAGEEELSTGIAKKANVVFTHGSATATEAAIAILDSEGTDLASFLAAEGTTGDLDNLTLAEIGRTQAEFYTIYRIDTDTDGNMELRVGSTSSSFDGSSEELRPIVLSSSNRFAKIPEPLNP